METFEHSKAMQARNRRRATVRELKIAGGGCLVGLGVFFINGGFSSLIWATAAGGVAAALAGALVHYSID
jgi:hypothetical protein